MILLSIVILGQAQAAKPSDLTDVQIGSEHRNNLYQKQDSIKNALTFIGTPEDRMDASFVAKSGQLASQEQLSMLNILFMANANKDVNMVSAILSDGTKRELHDSNNAAFELSSIEKWKFFSDNAKYFAVSRDFTDEDYGRIKKSVHFADMPNRLITVYQFDRRAYMLIGSSLYVLKKGSDYKLVFPIFARKLVNKAIQEDENKTPAEYGIVAFKQDDEAYTKSVGWKYQWNIELNEEASSNNTFEFLKLTTVTSGQADLMPKIAIQTLVEPNLIEKYKYKGLKCRFYVGSSEPSYNSYKYDQKLSSWSWCFGIASSAKSSAMFFPGENVTNIKVNTHGNFVGSDLELLSFETSKENIKYEHKVILKKTDSASASNPTEQVEGDKKQLSFGSVTEIIINDNVSVRKNSLIDFDSGKLFSLPDDWLERPFEDAMKWIEENGIDASGATRDTVKGLMCEGMIFLQVNNSYWDKVQALALATEDIWEKGKPGIPANMTAQGQLPATYIFKTREGGIGILQIISFTENPKGVKIRYKMVEKPTPQPETKTD